MIDSLADSVRRHIDALRQSWGWLADLVEPGRETTLAPVLTDAQRERIARVVRAERADRAGHKARGMGPLTDRVPGVGAGALGASPASARLGVIDAAVAARHLAIEAARTAAESTDACYIGGATGDAAIHDALSYLDGGPPCWIASRTGVIGRRLPFGVVDCLDLLALARVDALIRRADDIARAAAGVGGEESVRFPHPCPACGARSLQWSMRGGDRRTWSVACIRPACRCTGQGCACRQKVRYEGRHHAWSYGELDGTWGLWRAIAAARRATPAVRSGAVGHGGWPERSSR